MSALFVVCVFALISVIAILSISAVFGAILVLAYRDPSAGFSYFAGGVTASKVRD